MKVIQFLPSLESGGVERGTLEIAQALVNNGHESHVVSNGGRLVEQLVAQGSQHHNWPLHKKSPMTLRHIRPLRLWLESLHADVIHVRSRMPAWVVWLAWRKMDPTTRPKLITTLHGLHSVSRYSEIMGCGETVITVSNVAKKYLVDNYPKIDAAKIKVIHRGTDPQDFPRGYQPTVQWLDNWAQEWPNLVDQRLICLPGRLSRLKGHDHLIDLIQHLKEQGVSNVKGIIVGGADADHGNYLAALKADIASKSLQDDIAFIGHRSDIRDIYAVSSVVLAVSTKAESFGRTVLEPLSIGTPTIGFDIGGVGEILSVLFPEGRVRDQDADDLFAVCLRILSDEASTTKNNIKENSEFLLENMCRQTLNAYEELVRCDG
jgi:glycosyltransferase involved in cell wall biosynthesis